MNKLNNTEFIIIASLMWSLFPKALANQNLLKSGKRYFSVKYSFHANTYKNKLNIVIFIFKAYTPHNTKALLYTQVCHMSIPGNKDIEILKTCRNTLVKYSNVIVAFKRSGAVIRLADERAKSAKKSNFDMQYAYLICELLLQRTREKQTFENKTHLIQKSQYGLKIIQCYTCMHWSVYTEVS